jgi:hypothetical protein
MTFKLSSSIVSTLNFKSMATLIFDGQFIHETRITDLKFIEKLMQTNKKGDINEKNSKCVKIGQQW